MFWKQQLKTKKETRLLSKIKTVIDEMVNKKKHYFLPFFEKNQE